MIKHAVKYYAYSALFCLGAKLFKRFLIAEHGIYLLIAARVVFMIGIRFKNRI